MLTLDVQATPLAGKPTPGVVLVMHDVTELKRLEGLRQQFVANVSHELKTPLSSIKAYTETLLNGRSKIQLMRDTSSLASTIKPHGCTS